MIEEIDTFVAAIAAMENSSHAADLVDGYLSRSTMAGNLVTLHLTKAEAATLQFFANEAACCARRLFNAMDAELESEVAEAEQLQREIKDQLEEAADAINALPDELLRIPANDARAS